MPETFPLFMWLPTNAMTTSFSAFYRWKTLLNCFLGGHVGSIITNLHRLTNLTTFGCILLGESRSLPILPMPCLLRLIVKDLDEVNLSGLSKLNHFHASYIKKIQGKEDVYPNLTNIYIKGDEPLTEHDLIRLTKLRAFHGLVPPDCLSRIDSLNLPQVSLRVEYIPREFPLGFDDYYFPVPAKVRCLQMEALANDNRVFLPGRHFIRLGLDQYCGRDLRRFQNVTQFILTNSHIQDISAVRHIPYLSFSGCWFISNFGCLGSQKYLEINAGWRLKNEDVQRFDGIPYLQITDCSEVIKIHFEVGNRFLSLHKLPHLRELTLKGEKYIRVEFSDSGLRKLTVTGRIYFLFLRNCWKLGSVEAQVASRNCDHHSIKNDYL
jgi:hypothetical protein